MDLIKNALDGGHRILLFSQFTTMLSMLQEAIEKEGIPFLSLTGATKKEKRAELVETFQKGEVPVFCISLKAGGTGLNLTAADIVIHYDPWWNVAVQNQRPWRTPEPFSQGRRPRLCYPMDSCSFQGYWCCFQIQLS